MTGDLLDNQGHCVLAVATVHLVRDPRGGPWEGAITTGEHTGPFATNVPYTLRLADGWEGAIRINQVIQLDTVVALFHGAFRQRMPPKDTK